MYTVWLRSMMIGQALELFRRSAWFVLKEQAKMGKLPKVGWDE